MKLLDKIKNAIFEDEEFDEDFVNDNKSFIEEEKKEPEKEIVKKIDVEKSIIKKEIKQDEMPKPKREMRRTTPIIFDEEDFEYEKPKAREILRPEPKKEEPKKSLYGGYKEDKVKEKFKPSPVISPVYGFVGVSPVLERKRNDESAREPHIYTPEEKEIMSLDEVRMKAFGSSNASVEKEEDDDMGLLYEMEKDDTPAISKVTIGDAEEYFEDLGLEYNVDYTDEEKNKDVKPKKTTRSTKNKELSDTVDKEIENEKILESTLELEITKEQLKPKTAEEIRKVKKIDDINLKNAKVDDEEIDEKNLYDLIDMMYDSK